MSLPSSRMVAGAQSPRASDRIEEALRQMILTLELPPGAPLSDAYLAERLECGRTPLREALQRLTEQGLVEHAPGRGLFVTGLDLFDFAELMDALAGVLGHSTLLVTRRLDGAQRDSLRIQLAEILAREERARQQGDLARLATLDCEFHEALVRPAGNRYLSKYIAQLHRLIVRYAHMAWQRAGRIEDSLGEHRRIIDAFVSGTPEEAERAGLEHVENARSRILGSLGTPQQG